MGNFAHENTPQKGHEIHTPASARVFGAGAGGVRFVVLMVQGAAMENDPSLVSPMAGLATELISMVKPAPVG